MARKRARLTMQKRRPHQKVDENSADTEIYEVEKIVGSVVRDKTINYDVKWKGYSENENSKEAEYRMICDDALLAYTRTKIQPENYIGSVPQNIDELETIKKNKNYVLDIVDPLTSVAQTTVQGGTVKFANFDTVSSKWKFLKYIVSNKQSYVLNSFYVPPDNELRENMEQYQEELDQIQKLFSDYPKAKIMLPRQQESLFYSPPPLCNLLFEPVSEKMFEKRNEHCQFFPMSAAYGFNQVKPFVEPCYFGTFDRSKIAENIEMKRTYFGDHHRFKVSMKLKQQPGFGWNLHLDEDVEENTPLLLMTGVIRPSAIAQESLENDGELVAFSSFIEIPGTDMCLDRRELHDFSKYIPHSCTPTCGVRLVNSGNDIPDLVVYSLHEIDASYSYAITLDYYDMFRQDVKQYFRKNKAPHGKVFALYDREIDFVQCNCGMKNCLGVLHITEKPEIHMAPQNKKPKISNMDGQKKSFGGLRLNKTNTLFTIEDGKFVD